MKLFLNLNTTSVLPTQKFRHCFFYKFLYTSFLSSSFSKLLKFSLQNLELCSSKRLVDVSSSFKLTKKSAYFLLSFKAYLKHLRVFLGFVNILFLKRKKLLFVVDRANYFINLLLNSSLSSSRVLRLTFFFFKKSTKFRFKRFSKKLKKAKVKGVFFFNLFFKKTFFNCLKKLRVLTLGFKSAYFINYNFTYNIFVPVVNYFFKNFYLNLLSSLVVCAHFRQSLFLQKRLVSKIND